jgi:DNA-binding CsgD family transcriptional regulator
LNEPVNYIVARRLGGTVGETALRVLDPIYHNAFRARGWHSAARQLARLTGGMAAFFLSEEDGTFEGREAAAGADTLAAYFQSVPETIDFQTIEAGAAGGGTRRVVRVLKRRSRDGRSAGFVSVSEDEVVADTAWAEQFQEISALLRVSLAATLDLAFEQDHLIPAVLGMLGLPAMTLDYRGKVVTANAAFRDPRFPWTAIEGETLRVGGNPSHEGVTRLLAGGLVDGQSILLRDGRSDSQHSLHFISVPDTMKLGLMRSHVLALGSPTGAASAEIIRSLFTLSRAESQLARDILLGRSIEEIASLSDKSIHTVRNQLKGLLSKTGAHNQTQLATLMHRLVPSFDGG